jgi:hypothetical protein
MIPKQRREVQAASVEDPKDGETTQKEQERVIAQAEEPTRKCKR